ncbi:hypothetical protein OJAV_G00056870 [Oryzias javanicus]|uniref:Uncharacterized protein n=1 Tax=Oryzias javanicus TaxID=123683 RepID=A0A3S2N2D9_ORYJA|nr:hypothetical protein OJAV_G00056870 [Oryzias javanicus]
MQSDKYWVGTWRPHKPRGPVAALYGSPGPKYALPGLIGSSHHDPTKCKAPVFSFGTRCEKTNSNSSPGPTYLIPSNITRRGRNATPAFSISSRSKQPSLFRAPGPGQYSPEHSEKLIFHSPPAYSLSGRTKAGSASQSPGPGTYALPPMLGHKTAVTSSSPTYSLCGRNKNGSFHEDKSQTPGPAAYRAVDPYIYKEKPPQFSMTGRNFTPGEAAQKPGPGAYYPERVTFTRAKAPSFTFGLRHSQYVSPFIRDMES